ETVSSSNRLPRIHAARSTAGRQTLTSKYSDARQELRGAPARLARMRLGRDVIVGGRCPVRRRRRKRKAPSNTDDATLAENPSVATAWLPAELRRVTRRGSNSGRTFSSAPRWRNHSRSKGSRRHSARRH